MKLKELSRVIINLEMEAVSTYEFEAELLVPSHPKGAELAALYLKLAEEKRTRLKELGRIFKTGIGFRERQTPVAKSVEASLRTHAARAERGLTLYADLIKQLLKPEYKEAAVQMLAAERACLNEVRAMQSALKQ
jgi:hypothetical protein